MERCGSWDYEAAAAQGGGRGPTPFLSKTYQLVDDPATDRVVSWGDERVSTFVVWHPTEFARDILPNYFKHNNFASFVRQLNAYGFRKVVHDRWEFAHEFFRKGNRQLLCNIQRRPRAAAMGWPPLYFPTADHPHWMEPPNATACITTQLVDGGVSRASDATEMLEENQRLRQANTALRQELAHMRKLYTDIICFVQNHVGPVEPSHSTAYFLQEASARKKNADQISAAALNLRGRKATFDSTSLTIAEPPSIAPTTQRHTHECSREDAGIRSTERASTTMLFGVHLLAQTTVASGTKRAATGEGVHAATCARGRKPRLAMETGPDLNLPFAVTSVASSPDTTS